MRKLQEYNNKEVYERDYCFMEYFSDEEITLNEVTRLLNEDFEEFKLDKDDKKVFINNAIVGIDEWIRDFYEDASDNNVIDLKSNLLWIERRI